MLSTWICSACGFTALYTDYPETLTLQPTFLSHAYIKCTP
jgi:hypothetical protein